MLGHELSNLIKKNKKKRVSTYHCNHINIGGLYSTIFITLIWKSTHPRHRKLLPHTGLYIRRVGAGGPIARTKLERRNINKVYQEERCHCLILKSASSQRFQESGTSYCSWARLLPRVHS